MEIWVEFIHFYFQKKREAYELSDGVEFYVGPIRRSFRCPGDGYYADMDNDCQIFHICHTFLFPDGTQVSLITQDNLNP